MLSLNRAKNDTSVTLDLLRAVAAQMVCVGHVWNLAGMHTNTNAPEWGVLIFFILSGFVIAYTLSTKSRSQDYGLLRYTIDRTSRIYCAYLPAMLLMLIAETLVIHSSIAPAGVSDWKTFFANLAMLQMYPGLPFGSFGASGQTTSVAIEFHIYFFIGGLWFLCLSRNRAVAAAVAMATCWIPFANSLALPGRGLFVIWLAGFALYFALSAIRIDRVFATMFCVVGLSVMYQSREFFDPSDTYSLSNFPTVMFGFACIVVAAQCTRFVMCAKGIIKFFADYSLSLFLTHMVIAIYFFRLFPETGYLGIILVWVVTNTFAAIFARFTEARYKVLADYVFRILQPLKFHRTAGQVVDAGRARSVVGP